MRARKALVAAVALALGGALVAGCSADGKAVSSGATTSGVSSGTSSTATPTPEKTETVPATVAPPLPQPVGSVTKVKRQGQPATPSVSAPAVAFSKPVRYPDGVRLEILKAEKGTETGHGPGVMAGREYVRFQLRLTNGSSKPINLNEVVVTTFYSAKRQLAAPVYTESAKTFDFSGTVAAGKSATAYYAFAVPTSDLARVTMVVDFDGLHTSATYTGRVVAS